MKGEWRNSESDMINCIKIKTIHNPTDNSVRNCNSPEQLEKQRGRWNWLLDEQPEVWCKISNLSHKVTLKWLMEKIDERAALTVSSKILLCFFVKASEISLRMSATLGFSHETLHFWTGFKYCPLLIFLIHEMVKPDYRSWNRRYTTV